MLVYTGGSIVSSSELSITALGRFRRRGGGASSSEEEGLGARVLRRDVFGGGSPSSDDDGEGGRFATRLGFTTFFGFCTTSTGGATFFTGFFTGLGEGERGLGSGGAGSGMTTARVGLGLLSEPLGRPAFLATGSI